MEEEKNLAKDMKDELIEKEKYYENVRLELSKITLDNILVQEIQSPEQENQESISEYNLYIKFKDEYVQIATIDKEGFLIPNNELLNNERYSEEDRKKLGDMLNLLGLETEKVDSSKIQEQLKMIEAKSKEEVQQDIKIAGEDQPEQEKDSSEEKEQKENDENEGQEEKENVDEDKEKEMIAKKFNVSANKVVHLDMKDEKVTKDERFKDLIKGMSDYNDVYAVQDGDDPYSWKMMGKKKNETEYSEINSLTDKKIQGKYPNATIQRIDKDGITRDIKPLAMYDIDGKTAIAIVNNKENAYGKPEVLYCRKQEGEQKYWGTVVPEAAGKNVRQMEYGNREFMSSKVNSGMDLSDKEQELMKADRLKDKGIPTEGQEIQVNEISGNSEQNRQKMIDNIVTDLMQRDGVVDKITAPPGYYENKADKVLQLLENDDKNSLKYEDAVASVNSSEQREEGGRTPGARKRGDEE